MNRVLAAARLHLVNPVVALGVPWLIVASSFVINLAIWGLTDAGEQPGGGITGGLAALYITVLVVFTQSVTLLLPFAMGVSLSRRTFYLGTALMATGLSVVYGVVLTLLRTIEQATGGWGVGLPFWAPGRLDVGNPALQVAVYAAPMLLAAAIGTGLGVVYKRWGATGVWALVLASVLTVGALIVLTTWLEAWGSVGRFLVDSPIVLLAVGIPLVAAAVLGLMGFAGVRRVVP